MHDPLDSMPAVLDRQIGSDDMDAFGHRHFAQALRSLVESKLHQPPFSIGLLGGWGTGKSSIKELYTRALEDDASLDQERIGRKDRYKSITFNAWRFGGKDQDIKRALLRHVFLELGGDESTLHDRLFRNVTHSEQQWKGWREYTCELWRAWAMPLPALLIAMGLLLFFIWAGLHILPAEGVASQSALALIIGYVYSYLLKQLKPSKVDSFRSITKVSLPSATAEQYEEMLLAQLKMFKQPGKGIFGKPIPCERLIIFVDDLDRLSAEEMVLGLDAVRAFMEIPAEKLPEGLGLVFVISCDEAKVADALARGRSNNPEQPGTVFTHNDARRYLDRIFQFRLEIPPPPRSDMRQFALTHLSTFTEIVRDLNARGTSPELIIDRMIHVNVVDPRNALQIVNAFAQSWWLAKRREREGEASERPGGLHSEAVTGHPISLAALSAAKVSFPDFYRDLQDDPQLLSRLTSVLVHDVSILDLPADIRPLLLKRYVVLEDHGKDGKATKIREGCRELRQFLSSLVGIRWPDSLQSLLLLSEDPVSRKFGAGTSVIHGLLMSGDTKGVIEHLSPRADRIVLNDDQGHLLHQMVSDLHLETVSRRHNALRVLANLMGDLPARTVRLVLGPLCIELATSASLRSMIGVSKIASVLKGANRDDQRQVAAALVGDVCKGDAAFGLSHQNLQTPSLDDAKSMAIEAVEIILAVREEHGLPVNQDRTFVKWLHDRNITVASTSYAFPFSTLESWIASHEAMMMGALGRDYIDLLAIEVEAGRGKEIDMKRAAARVSTQFGVMAQAGEESRAALWEVVPGYLALREAELSACAFFVIEQHQNLMGREVLSSCMSTIVELLIKHPEPEMDFDRGFNWLMQCASSRFDELDDDLKERLAYLAQNIAGEHYAYYAVSLYEGVIQRDNTLLASVSEAWAKSLAQALPIKCCEVMFRCYERLPAAVKTVIASFLETGSTGAPLSQRFADIYLKAATEIPEQSWREPELQNHVNAVLSRLPSFIARGEGDLNMLLAGLTQVYLSGDPATIGVSLRDTFRTANSYPALLNLLHEFFATTWPTTDSAPGYTPVNIFNDAISTMNSYPSEAKKGVLRSLQSMIDAGLVEGAQQGVLTTLACSVWQTHSAQAEAFLASSTAIYTGAQIAALPDAVQWSNAEEVARLEKVWGNLAARLIEDEQVTATSLILGKGQVAGSELPDHCLTLWATSLRTYAFPVLKKVLLAGSVADDGRRRLWRQLTSLGQKPDDLEMLKVALRLLERGDAPETGSAVIADIRQMVERFSEQSQRTDIAGTLLLHLPKCGSMAVKAHLAVLAHQLGSATVLKTVDAASLAESDIQVITDKFGKSRELTNLRKRYEKLSA